MFKRLLVPLDTSELAEIALPHARELAIKLGAEVILMHVRTSADTPDKSDHKVYMSKTAAETEQIIKKSGDLRTGEKVKVATAIIGSPSIINHPAGEIVDYAEKENISLIVMATHGRSGISRWALGSTADKVARVSKCPVLLIRKNAETIGEVHFDKILVPIDGSKASENTLHYIENLIPRLKAKVNLLTVVEPLYHLYPWSNGFSFYGASGIVRTPYSDKEMEPYKEVADKFVEGVSEKLKEKGIDVDYEVRLGPVSDEIIEAEEEINPDMVIMSTHGHSGFGRWDHGNVTDKVLHAGSKPLLLVRPQPS
jgi:nucleotide-binding universal stress UspA family protein